jgi:hypothetical protein
MTTLTAEQVRDFSAAAQRDRADLLATAREIGALAAHPGWAVLDGHLRVRIERLRDALEAAPAGDGLVVATLQQEIKTLRFLLGWPAELRAHVDAEAKLAAQAAPPTPDPAGPDGAPGGEREVNAWIP